MCQRRQLSWEYSVWSYQSHDQASFPTADKSRHFMWSVEHWLWEKGARTGRTLKLASIWGNWKILPQQGKTLGLEFSSPRWPICLSYCFWSLLKGSPIRDTLPDHSICIPHPFCILLCTLCWFMCLHRTTWIITYLIVYVCALM